MFIKNGMQAALVNLIYKQKGDNMKEELLALHGFGPKALGILKNILEENGLSFMKEDNLCRK